MGEMASTLAHELNQPLGAIAAYMSGCRRILDRPTIDRVSLQEGFEGAAEQALRAGYIIKQIRAFIPRNESKPTAEDISEVVREFIALSGFQTPGLTITQSLDPSPILVLVDKNELFQVIRSLLCNAIEAMHDSPRRELEITTSTTDSGTAEIRIADRGSGVPDQVNLTLFDAFTTTKHNRAGLGLSISRTIVEAYGGRLSAEPNPGGGTIVRLSLPKIS